MMLRPKGSRAARTHRPKSLLMTFARVSTPALRPFDLADSQTGPSVVIFVRHGGSASQSRQARNKSPLDPAQAGLVENLKAVLPPDLPVVCSEMVRAIETARFFAEPTIDPRLNEIGRPWAEDISESLEQYFLGEEVDGWEAQEDACARMQACIEEHGDAIYVSHGTVLSLYLASVVPKMNGMRFWRGFRHPDAWQLNGGGLVRLRNGRR
jgi:broad specificity phosphatase PhoE